MGVGSLTDWILQGDAAAASPHAGGKARALARAERGGLPTPPWFVVSAEVFRQNPTADELRAHLAPALRAIAPDGALVAVRSSASDEDGIEHSFAGQLDSYLNVRAADAPQKIEAVWRSAFTDRIRAYRQQHNLPAEAGAPGVLVQRMVAARVSGVAFSADPVSGRRGIAIVAAVPGLGSAIVSGEADADTWLIDRKGTIVERRIVAKRSMHAPDPSEPGGVRATSVPAHQVSAPALTDPEVLEVAALARAAARCFGRPQDIEWAISDRLYLLQSRPITSIRSLPDPDAPLLIWDNSNIVESYSGVTTPLTFSFAREIYEHVYRQFCRMMGVPERVVSEQDETFRNMLGLIRGRLYYNLLNWYRLLAMLPGYRLNRRFMEQMMGVKEPLPDALASEVERDVRRGTALDALYAVRSVARLLANHMALNRRVDAFYARLEAALAPPDPPLTERRIDELVAHYRELRGKLLLHWDAPIVNDFFAMISYGLLRSLVMRWGGDPGGTLQNDLIGGEGGIVSAEPAVRMRRLAASAARHPDLRDRLASGDPESIRAHLSNAPDFAREFQAYLDKFGDRTVNELKLESTTLHDDPTPLWRAVAALASQHGRGAGTEGAADRLRAESRRRIADALAAHPIRRGIFKYVLGQAKRRVRDRENLRLERTRLFGRVRRIFLEIGRRLNELDLLDEARDVFYLEVDEVLAFADGRATTTDLRALASLRKREFHAFADGPAPDDRFETRGPVYHGHDFRRSHPRVAGAGDERKGLGCSPGIVRGPVRVVNDPTKVDPQHGAILVAAHTDPGWIMVFPSALGVLVERGSLLSHAAIVARELGIPAVVSVPGLTRWLKDGNIVEMDGSSGVVRRLDDGEEQAIP